MNIKMFSVLLYLCVSTRTYTMEFMPLDKNHSNQYFTAIFDKFLKAAQKNNNNTPKNNNFLYSIKRFKNLLQIHSNCHNILEFFELAYPHITDELNLRIKFLNKQQDLVPLFCKLKRSDRNSFDQNFSAWRDKAKFYHNQYEKENTSLVFNNNNTFFQIVKDNKNYNYHRDETSLLARLYLVAMINQLRDTQVIRNAS